MYPASPRPGQPNAQSDGFTPLPSCPYVPRTSPDKHTGHTYFFFKNGRRGIPLAAISKYNSRCWLGEQLLNVASSDGHDRPKITFRIRLQNYNSFDQQKNVLRQKEHRRLPITVGKAAECAAQVVMLWQEEMSTFGLQPPGYDLCLDKLVEIGGSLQIYLGLRPSNKLDNKVFSCRIMGPETPTRVPTSQSTVPHTSPWSPPMAPAAPPTAPAASAPFINQAGPSYSAQQPSWNPGSVPMPFTQMFSGSTAQDRLFPSPPPQSPPQTSIYLTSSYDTYGAGETYTHWVPNNGYVNAYPRVYGSPERSRVPTNIPAALPYPFAPIPGVSQDAQYYSYN